MNAKIPPVWQQQMRIRSFRLLGVSAPLMIASFVISGMIPHGEGEKEILSRPWGDAILVKGRLEMPTRSAEEIQTAFVLEGPLPTPPEKEVNVRFKSLDGGFDTRKRWKFKARKKADKTWAAVYPVRLPSGQMVAYRFKIAEAHPAMTAATLRVVIDPIRSVDKYLRMGEMLFYPALALCILAVAMLLFAKFSM